MKKFVIVASVALLMLGAAACSPSPYSLTGAEQGTAELGARDFAERSGGKYISCSGQDSDRDEYVTCSITTKDAGSQDLLCSYVGNSRGCKRKGR